MYNFDYVRPASVADAVAALASEDAQPISGGQTLIPTLKARLGMPGTLVDLTAALSRSVTLEGNGGLRIGAAATHATVAAEAGAVPGLTHLAGHIGDPQVRNRGTIGGSLANNDPAACYPAAALALAAHIVTNARTIAADDYFQGMFDTALEDGEIVTEVLFPSAQGDGGIGCGAVTRGAYMKFVQPASRFALVGVYVAQFEGGAVRVAVTGASESGVFRWTEAEQALSSNFSAAALDGLSAPAEGMIGDLHGTPEYRAHLIGVMTKRAVAAA